MPNKLTITAPTGETMEVADNDPRLGKMIAMGATTGSPDVDAQIVRNQSPATARGEQAAPQPVPGVLSRFSSSVKNQLLAPAKTAVNAMLHPVDTYNAAVDASAQNFAEAGRLAKEGEYGHALMHGVAGAVPPFSVVTQAGDKMREGDVAGALGDAVGAGLVPGVYGRVGGAVKGAVKGAAESTGNMLVRNPKIGQEILGGAPGAVVGGGIGGALGEPVAGVIVGRTIGRQLMPKESVQAFGRKLGGADSLENLLEKHGTAEVPSLVKGGGSLDPLTEALVNATRDVAKPEMAGAQEGELLPGNVQGLPAVGLDPLIDTMAKQFDAPPSTESLSEIYRKLTTKPILTPEEAQQLKMLEPLMKEQASQVGRSYAAGGK